LALGLLILIKKTLFVKRLHRNFCRAAQAQKFFFIFKFGEVCVQA
jgi:hypothetical protein